MSAPPKPPTTTKEGSPMIELDVERRSDWCYTPGQAAFLRIGPFGFGVETADGLSLSFAITLWGSVVSWSWQRSVR